MKLQPTAANEYSSSDPAYAVITSGAQKDDQNRLKADTKQYLEQEEEKNRQDSDKESDESRSSSSKSSRAAMTAVQKVEKKYGALEVDHRIDLKKRLYALQKKPWPTPALCKKRQQINERQDTEPQLQGDKPDGLQKDLQRRYF